MNEIIEALSSPVDFPSFISGILVGIMNGINIGFLIMFFKK